MIPASIGVRRGCRYPLRTLTPTGVVELDRPGLTLGDFFAVWGQALSRTRLLGFRGAVRVYLNGVGRRDDPRRLPLRDGDEVVLEVGGFVPPHRSYRFPRR